MTARIVRSLDASTSRDFREAPEGFDKVFGHLCDPDYRLLRVITLPSPSSRAGRGTRRGHDWDPRSEYSDFSGPVDQVGTTFVETSRFMAWDMKAHHTVVEVEPQRLLHHRSDKGFDIFFRLEPDGDATHLIVDCDYELPGHLPGVVKDLLSRSLVERTMRETGEKFRALAEATVPAPA